MAQKFDEFMRDEKARCEKFLKDSGAYDRVQDNIEVRPEEYYRKYGDREGRAYWEKICDIISCYERLAVVYKFLGEDENAKKMFSHISSIYLPASRYGYLSEEARKSWQALDDLSRKEIEKGAQLDLAGKAGARELFEWAAENLKQTDEMIAAKKRSELYNEVAAWYLWRGYALTMLGRYDEAYHDLNEVMPYFTLHKKSGGELWQKLEYNLAKALIPLCEYMLDPCEENRSKARKELEGFIKSLNNNFTRQGAYLYYFHLKEKFPAVYGNDTEKTRSIKGHGVKKPAAKPDVRAGTNAGYFIRLSTTDNAWDEDIGVNKDLEEYIEKVKTLGDYPVLANLMDLYVGEGEQEPGPLIGECIKLLASRGPGPDVKMMTEQLLKVALAAQEHGSRITLQYVEIEL